MHKETVYQSAALLGMEAFWIYAGVERGWLFSILIALLVLSLLYARFGVGWAVDVHNAYATKHVQPNFFKRLIVIFFLVAVILLIPFALLHGLLFVLDHIINT